MDTKNAIIELLKDCSAEVRWYVLAMIRNAEPSIYALSDTGKSEMERVTSQIKDYLSVSCVTVSA